MLALILGLVFVIASAYVGVKFWLSDVIVVLKGVLPIMFFFGGILAVIAGITSLKDEMEAKQSKEEEKK